MEGFLVHSYKWLVNSKKKLLCCTMNHELPTMNWLLDLLFPKRCVSCGKLGSYICRECFSKIEYLQKPVCPVCQRQAIGGKTHPGCQGKYNLDGLVVACRYTGPVRAAIQKVKYRWAYDICQILLEILTASLWKFDLPPDLILVPVPLHSRRRRWRGFNQAELLAKEIAKRFNQPYGDLISRAQETRTQVGLSKKARKENVRGVFALKKSVTGQIRDKNFLLVDDVYTSGATMQEAARVLKKAGANNVWAMAIALG